MREAWGVFPMLSSWRREELLRGGSAALPFYFSTERNNATFLALWHCVARKRQLPTTPRFLKAKRWSRWPLGRGGTEKQPFTQNAGIHLIADQTRSATRISTLSEPML